MTLPASGVISMDDIRTEFSRSSALALSQCYRDTTSPVPASHGLVLPHDTNSANVPTSGIISLDDFYGVECKARVVSSVPGGGGSVASDFANSNTVPLWTSTGSYALDYPGYPGAATGVGNFTVTHNSGAATVSWAHVQVSGTAGSTVWPNQTTLTGLQFRNQTTVPPSGSGHLSRSSHDRWTATVTVDGVSFQFVFELYWNWEIDY